MAKAPFAVWRGPLPSTNYAPGSPDAKIGACYHVIVGSLSSADGEFHTTGSQLSAHFGVAGPGDPNFADGAIVQWVDTADDAYAQGAGNYPPISYVSIEVAGDPSAPMTDAQLHAVGRIIAWAAVTHGFPLAAVDHGAPGVTTHCHYPSGVPDPAWGNHPCPGLIRVGQMPAVLAVAAAHLLEVEPMSIAIGPDGKVHVERVSPAGHLLHFVEKTPGDPTSWSVDDVTAEIAAHNAGNPQFLVVPG